MTTETKNHPKDFNYFREFITSARIADADREDLQDFFDDCDTLLDWCEEVNEYLKDDLTGYIDDCENAIDSQRHSMPQEWE